MRSTHDSSPPPLRPEHGNTRMTVLLLATVLVALQCPTCAAAVTNITSLCSPHATPPLVIKGQTTHVCININDKYRTVFAPVADQFTVLNLQDSWNDSRTDGTGANAFVAVSSMALRTPYKLYASTSGRLSPYLTAIVSVKQGIVQGVTWDDGCYFCEQEACAPNLYRYASTKRSQLTGEGDTCFVPRSSCQPTNANATSCDLTVYVGWTGTDAKGDYLSSAGLRMSQFAKYSLGSYFKGLASKFSSFLPVSRFEP